MPHVYGCCRTCRFADWKFGVGSEVGLSAQGECVFLVEDTSLPIAITHGSKLYRHRIFALDARPCPTWQPAKESK